jgi:hypothetical protein
MRLTDLLDELDIEYKRHGEHRHVTAGWLGVECIWCSPNTNSFKLGLNERSFAASCWACGRRPLAESLAGLCSRPRSAVASLLGALEREYGGLPEQHRGTLVLPKGLDELTKLHKQYLYSRGFEDVEGLAALWGLKGIGPSTKLAWRIFIPVVTGHAGGGTASTTQVETWTTRALSNAASPRYVNAAPSEERSVIKSLLYGEHLAGQCCVVVEGPFDAMKIGPGAVATFGSQYTRAQLLKISRFPVRVICFDSEGPAQAQAARLAHELEVFPGKTWRVQLDAKDPGSASESEISELRKRFLS